MSAADSMLAGNPSATWMRMSGGGLIEGGAPPSMLPGNPDAGWHKFQGGARGGSNDLDKSAIMKSIAFRVEAYNIFDTERFGNKYPAYTPENFITDLYDIYTGQKTLDRTNEPFILRLKQFHNELSHNYGARQFVPFPIQKYLGIVNKSSSCYISAAIQLIMSMADVKNHIIYMENPEGDQQIEASKYFREFDSASRIANVPAFDYDMSNCPTFGHRGVRGDSAEFLTHILDVFSEISSAYQLNAQAYHRCPEQTTFTPTGDPDNLPMLILPVGGAPTTIQDLINAYQAETETTEGGSVPVPREIGTKRCLTHIDKTVLSVPDTNKYVIIQLKRFDNSGNKINTQVRATNIIDISNTKYVLAGCINHSGETIAAGHYTYDRFTETEEDIIFNTPILYQYDDSTVTEKWTGSIDVNHSSSTRNYIYLYRRLTEAGPGSGSPPGGSGSTGGPFVPPGGLAPPPGDLASPYGGLAPPSGLAPPPGGLGSSPGGSVVAPGGLAPPPGSTSTRKPQSLTTTKTIGPNGTAAGIRLDSSKGVVKSTLSNTSYKLSYEPNPSNGSVLEPVYKFSNGSKYRPSGDIYDPPPTGPTSGLLATSGLSTTPSGLGASTHIGEFSGPPAPLTTIAENPEEGSLVGLLARSRDTGASGAIPSLLSPHTIRGTHSRGLVEGEPPSILTTTHPTTSYAHLLASPTPVPRASLSTSPRSRMASLFSGPSASPSTASESDKFTVTSPLYPTRSHVPSDEKRRSPPSYARPMEGGKKRTTQKRSRVMRKLKRTASKRKHN